MWIDINEKLPDIGQPVIVGWLTNGQKEVEYAAHVRVSRREKISYDEIFDTEYVMDIGQAVRVADAANEVLQRQGWVWAEYSNIGDHIGYIAGYSEFDQPTHWHPWPEIP